MKQHEDRKQRHQTSSIRMKNQLNTRSRRNRLPVTQNVLSEAKSC